ncbi:MAG TPA: amidase [Bacteroidales bacterium]|nr:amidase [Bacteroidales bacterium]
MYYKNLPLADTLLSLQNGSTDLLEFITAVCNRIEEVDPVINAFLPEPGRRKRMLQEALELLERYPNPVLRPSLFGIPVGVKDLFSVRGFPTLAGSKLPAQEFASHEAWVVSRLKEQGAIIAGKTVTTEFAYFEPGPTRNPVNINHTPGGSSSGSAAAVAAGLVPLALGTQTIGSVLRPAAYCGVFGFKPTQGRIPVEGIVPFSPQADHVGFFCHDLEGIRLAGSALVADWNHTEPEEKKDLRIGVVTGKYLNQADKEIRVQFQKVNNGLKEAGFSVSGLIAFEDIDQINSLHRTIIAYDFARVHQTWFSKFESHYSLHSKNLFHEGLAIPDADYQNALNQREELRKSFQRSMSELKFDLMISPSTTSFAPYGLASTGSPLMNLPWTFLGVPAISIPAAISRDGLPFGLQVTGNFGNDERLVPDTGKIIANIKK